MDTESGTVISGAETRRNSVSSVGVAWPAAAAADGKSLHDLHLSAAAAASAAIDQRSSFVPPPTPGGLRMGIGAAGQTRPWRVGAIYPVVPGRLSFVAHVNERQTHEQIDAFPRKYFFSADFQERYEPFCMDFGPVNLGVVHSFCLFLRKYWNCNALQNRELVYYSEESQETRTNCAFLLCAFLVVELGFTADQAWAPFKSISGSPFITFRDATFSEQDYGLTIHACLQGLHKAMTLGWYSPYTFDAGLYDYLDNPCQADMHFVSPKFLAFKGPTEKCEDPSMGTYTFPPRHYIDVFLDKGVTAVVRLNESSTYDAQSFEEQGIRHHELYFDDCTVPSNALVLKFLDTCEKEPGIVAVHCRAGLGRTGTMIAAYFIKHHGMSASECIGWLRIVRPGCVIGPQQQYLHWLERTLQGASAMVQPNVQQPWHVSVSQSAEMGKQVAEAQASRARARNVSAGGQSVFDSL